MPPLLFRNYRYSQTIITGLSGSFHNIFIALLYSQTIITELSGSFHNIFITSFVVDVSVPLRGLYPYKRFNQLGILSTYEFQSPCGDYTLISYPNNWEVYDEGAGEVSVPLRGLYPYKDLR